MRRSSPCRLSAALLVVGACAAPPAQLPPVPVRPPSSATRALCGDGIDDDDVAVEGRVLNAATGAPVDSAIVFVKWSDVTIRLRGPVTRRVLGKSATTSASGRFVICGVPAEGTLVMWAQRRAATTGAIVAQMSRDPAHVEFALDTTARQAGGSVDLDPDNSGDQLFPLSNGRLRLRIFVRDFQERGVANARVRIFGRSEARSDNSGVAVLDSVAAGTQMIEVAAVGFQPARQSLVVSGDSPADTVRLVALNALLDTVRITAGRGVPGFSARMREGKGQFITDDDILREKPTSTTNLIRSRKEIRLTYDRNGYPLLEATGSALGCLPLLFIDGYRPYPGSTPAAPGKSALDWLVKPDEIGGIEIYTSPRQVPFEFMPNGERPPCAVIAVWTKARLAAGTPKP